MTSLFTSATYERSIATVRKGLGVLGASIDFLEDADRVIAWIDSSNYATNSKKTFYIAIVSTLKKNELFPDALELYRAKMDSLNKQVQDTMEEQKLSPAEQDKYLEWPKILEAYERIKEAVHDLASFQDYLIVSLYVLLPPVRLDYANMQVVKKEPAEHGANYLVWNKKPYFLFTDYKTYKHQGAQRTPLPKELCDIIRTWFAMVDDTMLLISSKGGPMQEWELGQTLISVFEKYTGKKIGANILRHSHDTWAHRKEMSFKKSANLAKMMMHSQTMAQLYRRLT